MKNCEPALSRRPGTSTADTAPRVCFSALASNRSTFSPPLSVLARPAPDPSRAGSPPCTMPIRDHPVERRAVVGPFAGPREEVRRRGSARPRPAGPGRSCRRLVSSDRLLVSSTSATGELRGEERVRRGPAGAAGRRAPCARDRGADEQQDARRPVAACGHYRVPGRAETRHHPAAGRPAIVLKRGRKRSIRATGDACRPTRSTTASAHSPFTLAPDPQFLYPLRLPRRSAASSEGVGAPPTRASSC